MLSIADQEARKHGYHIAFSNPSFEYWFLLHFTDYKTELKDCDSVVRLLKYPDRLPDYGKSIDIYSRIKPNQETAMKYALRRLNDLQARHVKQLSHANNPSTSVVELVEFSNETTIE